MIQIDLSGRLKTIADMVKPCNVLCDVGTDHGYIPVYLTERGLAGRAVASDVRPGPVSAARKNIELAGLCGLICTRLGDGLTTVKTGECDCVVIAGMGGVLIRDIIGRSRETAERLGQLVLQPQNSQEDLRSYLYSSGFDITEERLAKEDEKFYTVMSVVYTGAVREVPRINLYIGEKLLSPRDPLLEGFLHKQIKTCNKILDEMRKISDDRNIAARLHQEWLRDSCLGILQGLQN